MIDLTFEMENGDCTVITDDDNMIASCIRRLDTDLDTTLYDEYGSDLRGLLGLRRSDVNLQFLSQSIQECLGQDERLTDVTVEAEYTLKGIQASISILYEDNVLEFTYDLNEDNGNDYNEEDDDDGGVE